MGHCSGMGHFWNAVSAPPMNTPDEHDDDLEPEVNEGAEIETEDYREDEDEENGSANKSTESEDDDSSDSI
jgi:hypothetical protein